jgi:hypothetical protein
MPVNSSLSGRKVSFIRLHAVTHIDGNGQIGPNISTRDSRFNDFSMTKVHGGVLLAGDGVRGMGAGSGSSLAGKPFEVYIPDAACQSIQLECEE